MPSKTEEYLALAQRTANGLTRYWESWTDYLTTASRLYKYPFADQLMIYAQRPDATACADFDIWNNRMNRYVRRGAKGIALLDESSGFPRLHYVFDVSDTGVRRNSRDPEVWQYNDDLKQSVSEMLSKTYGISGERVSQQLADVAGKLVADYWDMVLENRVIPDNKYKCMTRTGNRCYYKGAEKLTDAEYQNCVDALFAAWDRLEKWSASLPMTAEKKAESERFQVLSRQKKTTLACCTYVTEVEFEVAEAGQPTRWLCYSDADFAGFVVTDRSSIADDSKPQEYYEQVQVLESYEELEVARGSAYYALFAQMQKMAEEN